MREMSEQEYQNLHGQVSIKSIYEKKKGKEVSLDHFLFACHDTSKQLSELDHRLGGGHWPRLKEDLSELSLEQGIDQMVQWYKKKYPMMSHKGVMDVAKVLHVAKSFAYFEKDFKHFIKTKTGEDLEDHLLDQYDLMSPWTVLKDCLKGSLNQVGDKLWTYFVWAYGISPPTEVVPISEVPPMSRFRYNDSSSYSHGGHYRQSQGLSQKSKSKRNRHPNKISHEGGGYGGKSSDSKNYRSRDYQNNGSQNGNRLNKNHKPIKNHKKHSSGADKAKKKEVLAEVDRAISDLDQGQNQEYILAPQNSFYRRIQHKYIVDQGYESQSCGDDQNRAVKILKQKS